MDANELLDPILSLSLLTNCLHVKLSGLPVSIRAETQLLLMKVSIMAFCQLRDDLVDASTVNNVG